MVTKPSYGTDTLERTCSRTVLVLGHIVAAPGQENGIDNSVVSGVDPNAAGKHTHTQPRSGEMRQTGEDAEIKVLGRVGRTRPQMAGPSGRQGCEVQRKTREGQG